MPDHPPLIYIRTFVTHIGKGFSPYYIATSLACMHTATLLARNLLQLMHFEDNCACSVNNLQLLATTLVRQN